MREKGIKALGAKLPMSSVGRARERAETLGFMKVVVDESTKKILGAAILGVGGDEVAQTFLAVMAAGQPVHNNLAHDADLPDRHGVPAHTSQDLRPLA